MTQRNKSRVKRALITGVTGQDGSYLAELLLSKGYEVHGIKRRSSSFNTSRVDHLLTDWHEQDAQFYLHFADLSDSTSLSKLLYRLAPDEIYHLGAQSHVRVSFDIPEYTGDKQGLINVVNAAEYSREVSDLAWVLVGQGEDLPALKLAIEERAPNVSLLPLQPVASMPQMYAAADVLLLNQIATMEDAVIPCKLLTYMAAGRPIVAAVSGNSEAARVIRHANCGVIVAAEDPEALSAAVRSLKDDPKLRSQLGANARTYAEEHFNKAGVLEAYDEFFLRVLCTTEISLNTQQFPENLSRSQDLDSL
jgi:NAD(P)-dependent dehydrogenase (short-subunit alcohol dehydrogenase family)